MVHTKSSLLAAVSVAAILPNFALAQNQQVAANSEAVETVVVSGSLISRPGFSAPTPVSVVNSADLLRQAPTQIADALNILPQFGVPSAPTAGWQGISNQSAETLNLRQLGQTRTLVLLNGERVVPYSTTNTVDTSMLPSALIKRVDVVTGGASAAYGSDAVAGVVNMILDTDFVGLKGSLQYGNTTTWEYETYKADVSYGTTFDGDKIHLIGSLSYSDSPQSIVTGQMDWYQKCGASAIVSNPLFKAGNGQPALIHACHVGLVKATQGGLITSGPLKNTQFIGNGVPVAFNPGTLDAKGVLGYGGDATTFGQDGLMLGEPSLTYNGFLYASYQLTPDIKAHVDFDYGHSGGYNTNYPNVHQGTITVQADNAFLPASTKAALVAAGQTSFSLGSTLQNLTAEPRFDSPQFANYRFQERAAIGLEGSFGGGWTWSAHYGHGEVHQIGLWKNQDYTPFFDLAADAVFAPAGNVAGVPAGTIVCRSTLTAPTNGCQPMDLFGVNVVSPQAKAYIEPYNFNRIHSMQDDAQVSIQGEPFSDWAGPISVAAGADYRSLSAIGFSDPLSYTQKFYTGDFLPFHGAQNVYEGFGEVIVPLAKDASWSQSMDFNAAGRITAYSTSGTVETWKLGLTDQLTDEYRLRTTWSYDIRAPNLNELYNPGSILGRTQFDPLTNTTPQMQAFNSPIWLALEDYALQHAREDEMKISVFTGPYFTDNDPEMYRVRIPLTFWKVIAFIHDRTGELCATGYEMNQEKTLQPEEEFVFGAFTSPQLGIATQVPIRSIEARSGIGLGKLAAVDPLAGEEESLTGVAPRQLLFLEQIRFVR